jgi:hypothetical protein
MVPPINHILQSNRLTVTEEAGDFTEVNADQSAFPTLSRSYRAGSLVLLVAITEDNAKTTASLGVFQSPTGRYVSRRQR